MIRGSLGFAAAWGLMELLRKVFHLGTGWSLWPIALIMAVATTIGGYLGARGARRVPMPLLRLGITGVGLVMTVLFFAL